MDRADYTEARSRTWPALRRAVALVVAAADRACEVVVFVALVVRRLTVSAAPAAWSCTSAATAWASPFTRCAPADAVRVTRRAFVWATGWTSPATALPAPTA